MQTRKVDEETREIGFAQRQSDGRHDNAFHERRNDLSERGADYYCNCQVDHISASDELFEFSPHGCVLLLSNCRLPIANWKSSISSMAVFGYLESCLLRLSCCFERYFICLRDYLRRLATVWIVSFRLLVADDFGSNFSVLGGGARLGERVLFLFGLSPFSDDLICRCIH